MVQTGCQQSAPEYGISFFFPIFDLAFLFFRIFSFFPTLNYFCSQKGHGWTLLILDDNDASAAATATLDGSIAATYGEIYDKIYDSSSSNHQQHQQPDGPCLLNNGLGSTRATAFFLFFLFFFRLHRQKYRTVGRQAGYRGRVVAHLRQHEQGSRSCSRMQEAVLPHACVRCPRWLAARATESRGPPAMHGSALSSTLKHYLCR